MFALKSNTNAIETNATIKLSAAIVILSKEQTL